METRIDNIPNYLSAKSQMGLRQLMLKKNLSSGLWINYFDIQFVNGSWIAWFYEPALGNDLKKVIAKE